MLKETGYQEKFIMLAPWMQEIITCVKKDLRNEHLKKDPSFCRKHFLGKNLNQIELEEMCLAYEKEITSGNAALGEFIATRWLLKNGDIYGFFETHIKAFHNDFESLELLPDEFATKLASSATKEFGALRTYLFSVFNSVVFPKAIYEKLRSEAEHEGKLAKESLHQREEKLSLDAMQKRHAREMAMVQDRCEKRLQGMEKKYHNDTTALKKQIALLKKKMETPHERG